MRWLLASTATEDGARRMMHNKTKPHDAPCTDVMRPPHQCAGCRKNASTNPCTMCCQKRACSRLQQDTQVAMCAMPAACEHNDNPASMRTTCKTQHTLEHLESPLPAPREGQDALQSRGTGEDTVLKIAAALPALLRCGQQKQCYLGPSLLSRPHRLLTGRAQCTHS